MEPWCRSDLKWRKEGCLVEDVFGPKGVPQDHWGVLELKSSFKGAPYFPTAVLHHHWCQAQLLARSPCGSKASAWRWTQWQISGHCSLTVDFHLMLLQSEVWVGAFAWMVHKPNLLPELPLALGFLGFHTTWWYGIPKKGVSYSDRKFYSRNICSFYLLGPLIDMRL